MMMLSATAAGDGGYSSPNSGAKNEHPANARGAFQGRFDKHVV
jgi:hypothetical protein